MPSELEYGQSMADTGRTPTSSELRYRQSGEGGITGRTPMRNLSSHRQSGASRTLVRPPAHEQSYMVLRARILINHTV